MNDLLERYLYDVGRRLPASQREDILKELRSTLMDMIEERSNDPTAQDVAAVLKEYGRPMAVAAKYAGEHPLVGPELLPTYWLVLKIALGALALAIGIGAVLDFNIVQPNLHSVTQSIAGIFGEVVNGLLAAVGSVTLIFAALERAFTRDKANLAQLDWEPRDLPPVPVRRREERRAGHFITSIVLSVIALVVLNQYPQIFGFYHTTSEGLQVFPFFSPEALAAYVPLWSVGWIATIVLSAVRLALQRPNLPTRIAGIVLDGYWACVLVVMLIGPMLVSEKITAVFQQVSADIPFMNTFLMSQFRWAIALALAFTTVEIVRSVVKLARKT